MTCVRVCARGVHVRVTCLRGACACVACVCDLPACLVTRNLGSIVASSSQPTTNKLAVDCVTSVVAQPSERGTRANRTAAMAGTRSAVKLAGCSRGVPSAARPLTSRLTTSYRDHFPAASACCAWACHAKKSAASERIDPLARPAEVRSRTTGVVVWGNQFWKQALLCRSAGLRSGELGDVPAPSPLRRMAPEGCHRPKQQ